MKIIVFGATGLMGKELVKQALFNGDTVKAYGRNVFTVSLPKDDHLELVQGALFDEEQVYNALKGCDAVVSAIGGDGGGTDKTRSLGMKTIVQQMNKAGIKRIIGIGGMGILEDEAGKLLMEEEGFPQAYYAVSQEHLKAFRFLQESNLDWTFVCPPVITAASPTGIFTTNADHVPADNKQHINSGDLALFMLKEIDQREFVQHRVGISG